MKLLYVFALLAIAATTVTGFAAPMRSDALQPAELVEEEAFEMITDEEFEAEFGWLDLGDGEVEVEAEVYSGRKDNPTWKTVGSKIKNALKRFISFFKFKKKKTDQGTVQPTESPDPKSSKPEGGFTGFIIKKPAKTSTSGHSTKEKVVFVQAGKVADKHATEVVKHDTTKVKKTILETAPEDVKTLVKEMSEKPKGEPEEHKEEIKKSIKQKKTGHTFKKVEEYRKAHPETVREGGLTFLETYSTLHGQDALDATGPSIPPAQWNEPAYKRQVCNNCYNHGTDRRQDDFAQPGAAGRGRSCRNFRTAKDCHEGAVADGLIDVTDDLGENWAATCTYILEKYKGCFCTTLNMHWGKDFHWVRQHDKNRWSHKMGSQAADWTGPPVPGDQDAHHRSCTGYDFAKMYVVTPKTKVSGPGKYHIYPTICPRIH